MYNLFEWQLMLQTFNMKKELIDLTSSSTWSVIYEARLSLDQAWSTPILIVGAGYTIANRHIWDRPCGMWHSACEVHTVVGTADKTHLAAILLYACQFNNPVRQPVS